MAKIHIVIPVYNNWQMTHSQLFQLYNKERENIDSILIINDASPENMSGLTWWLGNEMLPLAAMANVENQGFLRTANTGIKAFRDDEDIVILLSSDVEIHGKFIQQIKELLVGNAKRLVGGILLSHDTGWNKFGDKIFPYLEGWLLATTVNNWKELGYFDDRYAPNDYEDVDLSTTALSLGYTLTPLNNPAIHHLGARSIGYNDARLERTNRNKKKFEEKWIK